MGYTLTKEQTEIFSSDKQFILIRGVPRAGKSFISHCLITKVLEYCKRTIYVILPNVRFVENYITSLLEFLGDYANMIEHIHRERLYIKFRDGNVIQFFIPSDILRYEFRGYQKPDLVIIDDANYYERPVSKRIFAAIKENYFLRAWNCKFYIAYRPNRKVDRLQGLYRFIGKNDNWLRKSLGVAQ
jgi:hypothetical protein